ncbi:TIM-barrel domain-containing protein [Dyella sp. A6]|uniref:TIM-barrel domain-containing protein n=1 Tax=Dyella aluminiiresistens TaxID=3069105 RepID=UPI002E790503|nr:TIM-barrel domain-containing protein [Dyella sp. A6]
MKTSLRTAWCLAVPMAALGLGVSATPADVLPHVQKLSDGIIVSLAHSKQRVRLQVVDADIVHVTATPDGRFDLPPSRMALHTGGDTHFTVTEHNGEAILSTPALSAHVALTGGAVSFFDAKGRPILHELDGGRSFTPEQVRGQPYYAVRQQFHSPRDEAFYGLGQHQEGVMNYKGKDVQLAQHNMDIAIPFVVSSRDYGVLWDNDSITRFGDPRPYRLTGKASPHLKLFDAQGRPGGLTATYYVNGKAVLRRDESDIDYQFLSDQKKYPDGLDSTKLQKVVWQGQLGADETGAQKFRLYASGSTKLYIDGKLVLDYWRQNWNPWYRDFRIQMKPGEKHAFRIVWEPQGGYIALQHLDPLPAGQQDELSLFSQVAKSVNYYFIHGNDLHDVIAGYRKVTGKSVMLPRWAYGYWQSRDHYTNSKEIIDTVEKYRSLGLPLDNIVQDWRYWKDPDWGTHQFDRSRYPHPAQMIRKLHELHAHFMISVWPKFYTTTSHYKELAAAGDVYPESVKEGLKDWVGPGYEYAFYDAFKPGARRIYWRQIKDSLAKLGVDAWWLDATEPDINSNTSIAERIRLMEPVSGRAAAADFNAFPLMTTTAVYQGSRRSYPDQRVFILTRSAFAGQQRNAAASWSGDVASRWRDLRDQISAGVNFSMSGIPNWTTDIGGYVTPPKYLHPDAAALAEWRALYVRWFQFGAFCPLFRSHGQPPLREIYNIARPGTPVYDTLAYYDRLRYRLMPYIYTLAADTYWQNGSIMRGLVMDFPHDAKVRDINDEYLFGPSFLVAPVTTYKATSRKVYLPAGTQWYDFNSGRELAGGQTVDAAAPLDRMPLFVRAGAIIPTGPAIQYTGEKPDAPITLLVYTGADGHFSLYEDAGTTYGYEQGHYSRVPFSYDNATDTLTIGARQGDGTGAPATREFIVRRIDGRHPDPAAAATAGDVRVSYAGKLVSVKL